jgi:hypothetical protein
MVISRLTLQLFSGLLAVIPAAIGLRAISSNKTLAGVFIAFLLVGISTDISMWFIVTHGDIALATRIFQVYSLVEALTFFWMVHVLTDVPTVKNISRFSALVSPIFWGGCVFVLPWIIAGNRGSAVFDSSYEIVVAFLTGFSLLSLSEKNEKLTQHYQFWLLLALFFYCFGTFFVMIFIKTILSQQIWFINNIVNVITYGLYGIGLWKLKENK